MAFQIKDFASITASAVNWMKTTTTKVTDFNIGSVIRTLIEAVSAEIDELYQQMFIGLREAIPVSVYNSFDFAALEAQPASGLVRVTVTSGASVLISSGTVFSVAGKSVTYSSTTDITIAAGGTYADVPVVASSAGVVGNLVANATFTASPAPDRFVSATNQSAFVNGRDAETDDERKVRFNAFIASLNRGTNAALEYGLKTTYLTDSAGNVTERVVSAAIVEPYLTDPLQPISLVNCYIHNGAGSTSSALVTRAREVIHGYYDSNGNAVPGWKAAGVKVELYAATEQAVNVTAGLTAATGYDKPTLIASATTEISTYLKELPIGSTAIRSEIIALAMNIEGVSNFVVSAPSGDTTAASNVKLMPGTFSIT